MFWNRSKERERAATIIKIMYGYYESGRSHFPERDELFYLAHAWAAFAKRHHPDQFGRKKIGELMILGLGDVVVPSFLSPPQSIEALAYYMLHKERAKAAKDYEPAYIALIGSLRITDDDVESRVQAAVGEWTEQFDALEY
jgi:hypothetical protein